MISNVIIDPHVAPSLEKRLFTQRILSTRSPRFVVINAEYSKQADVLAKSPDACTVDFLSNHEIILTKNNLQSPKRLGILLRTYQALSQYDMQYKENFRSGILTDLLRIFDVLSADDNGVLNELNYWYNHGFTRIVKRCDEKDLVDNGKSKAEKNRFKDFVDSLSNKEFQEEVRLILELLYQVHSHFIELKKKTEPFEFTKSTKLIWTTSDRVGEINYMTALAYYCMLSARTEVFLDSATPSALINYGLTADSSDFTVALNGSVTNKNTSPCILSAKRLYVSLQEPAFDLLLQKMVASSSDLIEISHISKQDLVREYSYKPYSQLIGKYLSYDRKKDSLKLLTVPNDLKDKIKQEDIDLSSLTKAKKEEEAKKKDKLHADKDEAINLPNVGDKIDTEIKPVLTEIKNSLNKLLQEEAEKPSDNSEEILSKIGNLQDTITKLQEAHKVDEDDSSDFVPRHHVAHDIFGNPEDETPYDVEQSLKEEFSKQDPSTKTNDPLQMQFDSQHQSNPEPEPEDTEAKPTEDDGKPTSESKAEEEKAESKSKPEEPAESVPTQPKVAETSTEGKVGNNTDDDSSDEPKDEDFSSSLFTRNDDDDDIEDIDTEFPNQDD